MICAVYTTSRKIATAAPYVVPRAGKGKAPMNDIKNGAGRVPGPMPPGAEAYASAMMRSLAGRSPEARQVLYEQLRTLWHVVNDPFPAVLGRMGMTEESCSVRFCVPRGVIREWCGSRRSPPLYVRLMMAEAAGLITLRAHAPRQTEIVID